MAGPMTVLDNGTYAGDAQIGNLPPGQHRLLSYSIDLEMHVDASKNLHESTIQTGRIVKGVLELTRKQSLSQEYAVENKSDRDRDLIVEHRFRPGWKLAAPSPFETTETHHRFRQSIAPGKSDSIRVVEEITRGETIAILPANIDVIQLYSRSGEIPEDVREVLRKTLVLKQALAETERGIGERRKQIDEISKEQERIRSNMAAVDPKTQYHARLVEKLSAQETAIEKMRSEIEQLQKTLEAQRKELEDSLMNTTAG
jgi:vacuolar-type H+-ATPase subunit I/STV1